MKRVKIFTDAGSFWNLDSSDKSNEAIINYFLGNTFVLGYPESRSEKVIKIEIDGVVFNQHRIGQIV
jgi:hypothetical protein